MATSASSLVNRFNPSIPTPWAILLCQFKDNQTAAPFTMPEYLNLFTAVGVESSNMVDYFRDVSHQTLDLSRTKVFGPFVLDMNRSDYKGSGANQQGRADLISAARQKAAIGGVSLSSFFSVVVVMNVPTDLFGGGDGAVCDPPSLQPSLLGQEMGHAYGLSHSRADGSLQDYQDPWDVMSTAAAYMTNDPNPRFGSMGPTLNAANMAGRGWLDESRVWQSSAPDFDTVIQLRPLVRYDLSGFLAARVDQYLIEFRVNKGWDAGIPQPVVLVHRFEDNRSYLMSGLGGQQGLTTGGKFQIGDALTLGRFYTEIDVLSMDPANDIATLHLSHRSVVVQPPSPVAGPLTVLGGVAEGGGGIVLFRGQIIHVPPRSPVMKIIEKLVEIEASAGLSRTDLRDEVRRGAYSAIADQARFLASQSPVFFEPSPPSVNAAAPKNDPV
jgi:hypothetical protein